MKQEEEMKSFFKPKINRDYDPKQYKSKFEIEGASTFRTMQDPSDLSLKIAQYNKYSYKRQSNSPDMGVRKEDL